MRLSITTEAGELHSLSLPPSLDLASLRALVAAELSAANASSVVLLHNGAVLDGDARTLLELGVVEDDILLVRIGPTRPAAVADTAELARLQLLADAGALERLARAQPAVADAALNNPTEFRRMFRELERARREAEERRATELVGTRFQRADICLLIRRTRAGAARQRGSLRHGSAAQDRRDDTAGAGTGKHGGGTAWRLAAVRRSLACGVLFVCHL
ncbi:hypothetical protein DFJ74DRAFT_221886 [Hyaloraphidium curvatum]|nr:hypothetical protein DFJ74DRAFT_221886 [Hyaloraphidium curvatum]